MKIFEVKEKLDSDIQTIFIKKLLNQSTTFHFSFFLSRPAPGPVPQSAIRSGRTVRDPAVPDRRPSDREQSADM